MKQINILIITLLLAAISNAQINSTEPTSIVDIETAGDIIEPDTYLKDINNFYNPFEGTWLYSNGITSLKIVLTKNIMQPWQGYFFDDLIGQYEYKENNIVIRSTLNNPDNYNCGMYGSHLLKNNQSGGGIACPNCPTNERRVTLTIWDYDRDLGGHIYLKRITVNGLPALEGFILGSGVGSYDVTNPPQYFYMAIPTGTFVFIKQ